LALAFVEFRPDVVFSILSDSAEDIGNTVDDRGVVPDVLRHREPIKAQKITLKKRIGYSIFWGGININ
jgi:hypothetical protein